MPEGVMFSSVFLKLWVFRSFRVTKLPKVRAFTEIRLARACFVSAWFIRLMFSFGSTSKE